MSMADFDLSPIGLSLSYLGFFTNHWNPGADISIYGPTKVKKHKGTSSWDMAAGGNVAGLTIHDIGVLVTLYMLLISRPTSD